MTQCVLHSLSIIVSVHLQILSEEIIFIVVKLLCDGHFLCFRLTTQLCVQLHVQILGWAYTRVHNEF